jgi:hypothetical protein
MTDDHDLFNYAPPPEAHARPHDPDTSHDAAKSLSPRLRQLQALVLDYAASQPDGFTDVDMNQHFDTHASTYRTRRSELVEQGYIRDSGERQAYGANGTGRRHVIWQITLEGLKANE